MYSDAVRSATVRDSCASSSNTVGSKEPPERMALLKAPATPAILQALMGESPCCTLGHELRTTVMKIRVKIKGYTARAALDVAEDCSPNGVVDQFAQQSNLRYVYSVINKCYFPT